MEISLYSIFGYSVSIDFSSCPRALEKEEISAISNLGSKLGIL